MSETIARFKEVSEVIPFVADAPEGLLFWFDQQDGHYVVLTDWRYQRGFERDLGVEAAFKARWNDGA